MHRGICSLRSCLDHQHSVCLRLSSIRLALSQRFWMRDATVDTKMLCSHVDVTLSVFKWTFMATVLRSLRELFYCHIQHLTTISLFRTHVHTFQTVPHKVFILPF